MVQRREEIQQHHRRAVDRHGDDVPHVAVRPDARENNAHHKARHREKRAHAVRDRIGDLLADGLGTFVAFWNVG